MASFQVADGLATAIYNKIKTTICNLIYPVGSIKMTTVNTNPSTYLGGTWSLWGSGRVPIGVNTSDSDFNKVEKTGGNKSNNYSFNHTHAVRYGFTDNTYVNGNGVKYTAGETIPKKVIASHDSNWSDAGSPDLGSKITLNTKTISTIQPYITCYMWKRTA